VAVLDIHPEEGPAPDYQGMSHNLAGAGEAYCLTQESWGNSCSTAGSGAEGRIGIEQYIEGPEIGRDIEGSGAERDIGGLGAAWGIEGLVTAQDIASSGAEQYIAGWEVEQGIAGWKVELGIAGWEAEQDRRRMAVEERPGGSLRSSRMEVERRTVP